MQAIAIAVGDQGASGVTNSDIPTFEMTTLIVIKDQALHQGSNSDPFRTLLERVEGGISSKKEDVASWNAIVYNMLFRNHLLHMVFRIRESTTRDCSQECD